MIINQYRFFKMNLKIINRLKNIHKIDFELKKIVDQYD
mgnify:CR=1 FL=1